VDKGLRVLREFVHGPGYVHVSQRTSELACQLLPRLFALRPRTESTVQSPESKVQSQRGSRRRCRIRTGC
jgi:hypothetical protein